MTANFTFSRSALALLVVAGVAAGPGAAPAQAQKVYDALYAEYLSTARTMPTAIRPWIYDLTGDRRARHVNDLVTIRVVESLSANGAADSTINKSSAGDVFIPGTQVGKILERIVPNSTDTQFNGSGGTNRTTQLSATLTARVMEVLPNGDLVVEGVREVVINGDSSIVVLTGVVRQNDIGTTNTVLSPFIGQLRIQAYTDGVIKDSLKPGWLIRILNKIF